MVYLSSLVLGFIASSPLLVGCQLSLFAKLSQNVITTIMAFGSGVLIATLTFSILIEAFNITHTLTATAIGFILGGVSYSVANLILERKSKSKGSKIGYTSKSDGKVKIASDKKTLSRGNQYSSDLLWTTYLRMQRLESHLLHEVK